MVLVVFVNVLFVTESPIEGRPCDELECCGPFVVFVTPRPVFELQMRLTADQTWKLIKKMWNFSKNNRNVNLFNICIRKIS